MAIRDGMSDLIQRVRGLIVDPAGASQQFDDQTIQDALDRRRARVRYLALTPVETIAPGGAVTTLEYAAPLTDWETDGALVDGSYASLTPETSDWQAGVWTFASDTPAPVSLSGATYDVYATAADLLERWAAAGADLFDFAEDGQSFKRSQIGGNRTAQAAAYRAQQRPALVSLGRSDLRGV